MADVAEAAGVSLATVDRALNGRGTVRQQTLDLVLRTAGDLGYVATSPQARTEPFQFDVVLPAGTNAYLQLLTAEIEAQAKAHKAALEVRIRRVEDFKPEVLAAALDEIADSDGVAIIAPDHPAVREALRGLKARRIPVATLVTDVANIGRIGYVGIDNRAAGRLAGQLLGRLVGVRRGAVLLFLGSRSYRGHEEREIGFRDIFSEEYAQLEIVDVRDMRDDIDRARRETERLLKSRRDIVGIYNVAGGNRGIAAALLATRRSEKIVFIAHELTQHSRPFLISGLLDVAIDQNPHLEAAEVIRLLHAHAAGEAYAASDTLRITPFFRENLP